MTSEDNKFLSAFYKGQQKAESIVVQLNITPKEQLAAMVVANGIIKVMCKSWKPEVNGNPVRIIVAKAAVAAALAMIDEMIETDANTVSSDEGMSELIKKFSAL
jgi:hypothetical protein